MKSEKCPLRILICSEHTQIWTSDPGRKSC